MNAKSLLLIILAAGAAVLLLRKSGAPKPSQSPVVHLVEETLQEHQGEDSPVVLAFEAALAHQK